VPPPAFFLRALRLSVIIVTYLSEVACFYRSLAGIIPAMPTQYKIKVGPCLTRAERWHARAEECRTLADCFTDPTCREQLRQLAQSYDCMAVAAE